MHSTFFNSGLQQRRLQVAHLTKRRKEIDAKYEYKYSVLLLVLADLVRENRISLDELDGLAEDKLRCIRDHATSAT